MEPTEDDNLILMLAVLCHDLGKVSTTSFDQEKGRICSNGHDEAGVAPARAFLNRMNAPNHIVNAVVVLVREHLKPFELIRQNASPPAYRRLARRMGGVSFTLLAKVAIADNEGRICYDPKHQTREDIETFLRKAGEAGVDNTQTMPEDVVKGRHLLEKGMKPGPQIGQILQECRSLQDETGEKDPEKILAVVLRRAAGQ